MIDSIGSAGASRYHGEPPSTSSVTPCRTTPVGFGQRLTFGGLCKWCISWFKCVFTPRLHFTLSPKNGVVEEWGRVRMTRGTKERSLGFSPCHYPQIQLFAPSAFGNRPVRPESQPRATRTNRCSARRRTPRSETCARPPRPAPGLKGRFQRSQVRKHLVRTLPPPTPGLKGRFQQSQVHEHLETPCTTAKTRHALKSALQA